MSTWVKGRWTKAEMEKDEEFGTWMKAPRKMRRPRQSSPQKQKRQEARGREGNNRFGN